MRRIKNWHSREYARSSQRRAGHERERWRLLFVSTDYVFDGTRTLPYEVDDVRSPRSVYGISKAEAEVELERILPEVCIARTSWLYGMGGKCFPDTILKLAATRPALDVVTDQRGSPTYAVDLASASSNCAVKMRAESCT